MAGTLEKTAASKSLGSKEYAIVTYPGTGTFAGIWVGQPDGPEFYRPKGTLKEAEAELQQKGYTRVSAIERGLVWGSH